MLIFVQDYVWARRTYNRTGRNSDKQRASKYIETNKKYNDTAKYQ